MSLVPASSQTLATVTEATGLEDVDQSDLKVPRLSIDGKRVCFVDDNSGREYPELIGVALGLIKQRVLWEHPMPETASSPLCKSFDHKSGRPGERFPWAASGFDEVAAQGCTDADGIALPCESCALQEWESHPDPGRKVPWCAEQYVIPFMVPAGEGGSFAALLTFQRSGLKAAKAFVGAFASAHRPLFTVATKITLEGKVRGQVHYAEPRFTELRATKEESWDELGERYRNIATFLRTVPAAQERENPAPESPADPGPAQPTVQSAVATPEPDLVPTPADVVDAEIVAEDEIPW